MIVKNEMANLERCLTAVAPVISCWVIGDTGSTDGTQAWIREFFTARGLPGELHEFPFVDFAQARNEALHRARASRLSYDYLLLTDADMELVVDDPAFAKSLTAEIYQVLQRAGVSYWNTRLIRRDADAEYRGVTHEFVDLRRGSILHLEGISYIDHASGSNRVEKYERDARLLRTALDAERDDGMIQRYTFYLANTLSDAGKAAEALPVYQKRAALGGWQEEVFMSLYNAARLTEQLGYPDAAVIAAYERATAALPSRAEALHDAARFCREKGFHERGYAFAKRGLAVAYPSDGLFVADWMYDYGLRDELAVNAYWCGRYAECVAASERLLAEGKIPDHYRERIKSNRDLAAQRLRNEAGTQTPAPDARSPSPELEQELRSLGDWLALAQMYMAAGRLADAAAAYARCAEANGRTEEGWHARLQQARCLKALGDIDDFLFQTLAAFNEQPKRAEAIYELARYYREQGMNDVSLLFSEQGLTIPIPSGRPRFLEFDIYHSAMKEEFSICANYATDKIRKDRGHAACNWLAVNRDTPEHRRNIATSNLHYYAVQAAELLPSLTKRRIDFTAPEGYNPLNPSIARFGSNLMMIQRSGNWAITEMGEYYVPDGGPVNTRNFLLELDHHLNTISTNEILLPLDWPAPRSGRVLGFEDMRLFEWNDALWCSSAVMELNHEGWCQQVLARIERIDGVAARLCDWRVLSDNTSPCRHEKNWMPQVDGGRLRFLYSCDPTRVVDDHGKTVIEREPPIAAFGFRGGSQMVQFSEGWLALIHEVTFLGTLRHYGHRFVWIDKDYALLALSRRMKFSGARIEFVTGLAWHPDGRRLLISYGVDDRESWIAAIEAADVCRSLEDVSDLPTGAAGTAGANASGASRPGPWWWEDIRS